MTIKQTLITAIFTLSLAAVFSMMPFHTASAATCAGVETSIVGCEQPGGTEASDSGVWGLLLLALNIMTAGVGILAVGGIVYAAVLYTSATDSTEQTQKAKEMIRNIAIGIAAYAGMYVFLNFLLPGGIFS